MKIRIILLVVLMLWSGPVFADEPLTITQMQAMLDEGKRSEVVELVVADLEQWNSLMLLFTSNVAIIEEQFKHAAILYHAGKIRAKIDLEHYKSSKKGGNSPATGLGALISMLSQRINSHPAFSMPTAYHAMAEGLTKWEPQYTSAYDPGWPYEQPPNLQKVQEDFNEYKNQRVHQFQGLATLLENQEYVDAFSIVKAYNIDVFRDQNAPEKLQAEETMKRIETELGIAGFMASIEKRKKQLASTKCYQYSADGKKTECKKTGQDH